MIADSESTQKTVQTRIGIIDLGAFCVELWPKQVSYRISVPMSYISCSRLIYWFVCFCLFYSFSATVKMVVYKNANNKRRAAIYKCIFQKCVMLHSFKQNGLQIRNQRKKLHMVALGKEIFRHFFGCPISSELSV